MEKKHAYTLAVDEGQYVSVVGDTYRILISGKETGGAFAIIDMLVPPGGGPGPHAHAGFQESFYVVDGQIEVKSENGNFTAKKGAYVNIPLGGMVHCFKNTGKKNAHLICTVVPAGLEEFFLEIGKPVKAGEFLSPPEMDEAMQQKMQAVAEKHDQKLYPPDYFGKK